MQTILWAAQGTGFTCCMTAAGAAMVFLFRKQIKDQVQQIFLGFAAGVMIAASIWSLLIPAIEQASGAGNIGWIPAAGGFLLGGFLLMFLDGLLESFMPKLLQPGGDSSVQKSTLLLVLAVTLHNIPEGMAVGLSFAMAAAGGNEGMFSAAVALAIGIGIQNFPEGAAVSLPLRQSGCSAFRSFVYGSLSGVVEPLFGILVVLVAGFIRPLMPWMLSFAAGAMMYVVIEELIPGVHQPQERGTKIEQRARRYPKICCFAGRHGGIFSVFGGFLLMMILDVALG